jgi:hypothetical protein
MLPDLPQLKSRLLETQMKYVRWAAKQQMPAFGDCAEHPIFEGSQHGIERATGDTEINSFNKIGAEVVSAPHMDDLEATFEKLYAMGGQLAEQFEKNAFKYICELMDRTGQTVKGENGKFTVNTFLEALSKVEFPLGADGNIDLAGFRLVVNPVDHERVAQEIENSPELMKKMTEILEKKQEAARAREADRKLVG